MDVTQVEGRVYKRATTPDEARRLGREARVLRSVAHPGVVRVLGLEGGEPPAALVLLAVTGGALARTTMPPGAVARLGAAVAMTVADLHEIGWVHGSLRSEHILIDADGYPVLCSFGSAVQAGQVADWDERRRRDLRDLVQLLSGLLPSDQASDLHRILERARSCRRLASDLKSWNPVVVRPRKRRRRRYAVVAVAASVPVGLGLVLGPILLTGPRAVRPVACPEVDLGCVPVTGPVAGNIRLIASDRSVVVMGRWRCGQQAFPAVLNPVTGALWLFDSWPRPGRPVEARLRTQVPGAAWLKVKPGRSGCDQIEVGRPGRRPLVLAAGGPG